MAKIRYNSTYKSTEGVVWKVEMIDDEYDSTPADFTIESLEINYQSDREDLIFAEILASEITLVALSENTAFDAFINQLFEAAENRFFVKVYKDTNLYWVGQLLPDASGMEDAYYPQKITLKAVDGLARLKSIDFNSNGSGGFTTTGNFTFTALLFAILADLRTIGLWDATDVFLDHNVHWADAAHVSGVSVLENTRVDYVPFYHLDDDNLVIYKTSYEVLEKVCEAWSMRIMLEGGVWKFRQLNEYELSSSVSYLYLKNGSYSTTGQAINRITSGTRLATQNFSYLPALKSIHQCYVHNSDANFLTGKIINLSSGLQTVATLTGGTGTYMLLAGKLKIGWSGNTSPANFFKITAYIEITFGSNYLYRAATNLQESKDYSNISWEASTKYVEYVTEVIEDVDGDTSFNISLQTPVLAAGDADVKIRVLKHSVLTNGGNTNVAAQITVTVDLLDGVLEYYSSSAPSNKRCFDVENGTSPENLSEIHKLDDAIFGDAVSTQTPVKLEVYDGSAWVDSTDWSANSGTAYEFTRLLLVQRMAMQRKTVLRREGVFKGAFNINDVLQLTHHIGGSTETRYFAVMRATLNTAFDEWSGVWWNIKTNLTTIITSITDITAVNTLNDDKYFNPPTGTGVNNPLLGLKSFTLKVSQFSNLSGVTITGVLFVSRDGAAYIKQVDLSNEFLTVGLDNIFYGSVTYLSITSNTNVTALGVSTMTNLTYLRCDSNSIIVLDVSILTNLTYLNCTSNEITVLNVSSLTNLVFLYCATNEIIVLDVSALTNLTYLRCNTNEITVLNVTLLINLTLLSCQNNQLTVLDISALTNLTYLQCNSNQLTVLDVSALTSLTLLHCNTNQLTVLDASGLTSLTVLYCQSNKLTALDLNACTSLTNATIHSNELTAATNSQALVDVDTHGLSNGYFRYSIYGGGSLTTAGAAAVTSLQGKGWTIVVS